MSSQTLIHHQLRSPGMHNGHLDRDRLMKPVPTNWRDKVDHLFPRYIGKNGYIQVADESYRHRTATRGGRRNREVEIQCSGCNRNLES